MKFQLKTVCEHARIAAEGSLSSTTGHPQRSRKLTLGHFLALMFCLSYLSLPASAQETPFSWDDFDRTKLDPWNLFRSGRVEMDGDSLSFYPSADDLPGVFPGTSFSDFTVRTRIHFHDPTPSFQINPWVGIYFRNGPEFTSYWAGPSADGLLYIGESGGGSDVIRSSRQLFTREQILNDDIEIEIRALGDTITASAWIAGTTKPASPTLTMRDNTLQDGTLGFIMNPSSQLTGFDARYFAVLPAISGDFNGNGVVDAADVNLLAAELRTANTNRVYDLNDDGLVDDLDYDTWVSQAAGTYYGDANLDGEFNSGDFVAVFEAGEYEDAIVGNSTWATGDWNGDGEFGSGDFVVAFEGGGYEQGPRAATAVLPEPSSSLLATIAGVVMLLTRRRQQPE